MTFPIGPLIGGTTPVNMFSRLAIRWLRRQAGSYPWHRVRRADIAPADMVILASPTPMSTAPAGWTLVTDSGGMLASRVADGTPNDLPVPPLVLALAVRWAGVNPFAPVDVDPTAQATGTAPSPSTPSTSGLDTPTQDAPASAANAGAAPIGGVLANITINVAGLLDINGKLL